MVPLNRLAKPAVLLGEDPNAWEGRVRRPQRPYFQPAIVCHLDGRIQVFGDPIVIVGFGFPAREEPGVVGHTPGVVWYFLLSTRAGAGRISRPIRRVGRCWLLT